MTSPNDTGSSTPTVLEQSTQSNDTLPPTTKTAKRSLWSRYPIGRGMYLDVKARLPYYVKDWTTDAWDYRVVPATFMIFFANILPGIAFSLDLIERTGQYGVQEVLLSTVGLASNDLRSDWSLWVLGLQFMAAFIASVLGGQPLVISGVTGPISVFNSTIYLIFQNTQDEGYNYLNFIGWVYLWGAILHWITALGNGISLLKYVTRFPCDTFGFYVAWIYIQFGVQVITRQFEQVSDGSAFLGIVLAIIMLVLPHLFNAVSRSSILHRHFRRFCSDYGMPISLICVSALAYWGRFDSYAAVANFTLPTNAAFQPATGRQWLVKFWELDGKYVGIAFPFGVILFILFYFDANVSSLIAQGSEFPLKKPPAFHWDFFLLGVSTFIAGLLGIPAPNGLIPQAPIHTSSLVVMGFDSKKDGEDDKVEKALGDVKVERKEVPVAVIEQRWSNFAQGAACLVLMSGPFQKLLHWIPKGTLSGLFWYMGSDALAGSSLTGLFVFLIRDRHLQDPTDPLHQVRKSRIIGWMSLQLLGFAATFAITQTIAAIGFPVVIASLIPIRVWIIPRLGFFSSEELGILDGPVASPFTMASVGGSI